MNQVFAAKLPDGDRPACPKAATARACRCSLSRAPGTIPSHVNPPRGPVSSSG